MKRCGECQSENITYCNVIGRMFPYMEFKNVRLVVDLFLHVCKDCGNEMMFPGDCKRLDEAIEESLDMGCFCEKDFPEYVIRTILEDMDKKYGELPEPSTGRTILR